jgi:hypothetical protein
MNKRDALRLKPGDLILYGSYQSFQRCIRTDGFHHGEVIYVTPNGGIKVEMLHPDGVTPKGANAWVPYNHVCKVTKRDDRSTRAFEGPASGTVRT